MIDYTYTPKGVCARAIHVQLSDDGKTLQNVEFTGGCNGNLHAISKLVAGMPVETVTEKLRGNTCGPRPTSCADQMCAALDAAISEAQA